MSTERRCDICGKKVNGGSGTKWRFKSKQRFGPFFESTWQEFDLHDECACALYQEVAGRKAGLADGS